MKKFRTPLALAALASFASVGSLHAQQTTTQGINQRDSAATNNRSEANQNHQQQQGQQGVPLKQALVQKLKKANEAEIELAKLAMERSENEQVQQFAKMIVEDHQACNQKLQEMNGQPADSHRANNLRQSRVDAANNAANKEGTANTPRTEAGVKAGEQGRQTATDSGNRQGEGMRGNAMVPGQLVQIMNQACDNSLKMTKEMLQKYEGQDFSMAFLGQQCVAHTMMLAELKAIQSQGPEELKSFAEEAAGKVQKHLEKAKQLAKQLEDDRGTTRAASR